MIKSISKGYTITVVSWENDADNYKTNSIVVETKEIAKTIHKMCSTLFKSCDNKEGGIGNTTDSGIKKANEKIVEFMNGHPELYVGEKVKKDKDLIDICFELYIFPLLDSCEYYYSRVAESCVVTYSDVDVFVEEIKF